MLRVTLISITYITAYSIGFSQSGTYTNDDWSSDFSIFGISHSASVLGKTSDGRLIMAGAFRYINGIEVNGIAIWDGDDWPPLTDKESSISGVNGGISAIVVEGDNIYVGGSFTSAGGENAPRVAMWDGESWSSLYQVLVVLR